MVWVGTSLRNSLKTSFLGPGEGNEKSSSLANTCLSLSWNIKSFVK
jgi:hypothetical protein